MYDAQSHAGVADHDPANVQMDADAQQTEHSAIVVHSPFRH